MGIALFLLYATEAASRSTQEARIAKLKVHAEKAYYAAEAGFNRVRAAVVACKPYATVTTPPISNYSVTLDEATVSVAVIGLSEVPFRIQITSSATYGASPWDVTRTVSGTVERLSGTPPCKTRTTYD